MRKEVEEAERVRREAESLMLVDEEMSEVSSEEEPLKVRNHSLSFLFSNSSYRKILKSW